MLPNIERQEHIYTNVKKLLVSIGALCDDGCTFIFKKKKELIVILKNDIILLGLSNHQNKLWYLTMSVDNEDKKVGDNENNLVKNVYEKTF